MSRVHLYRISQRVNSFKLYVSFKKKGQQSKKRIRCQLKLLRRVHKELPKDIWRLILNKLPDEVCLVGPQDTSMSQIIDLPPPDMTVEEFLTLLHKTLINSKIMARNPLIYTTFPEETLDNPHYVKYGSNSYMIYPSLVVTAYDATIENKNRDKLFLECPCYTSLFLGIKYTGTINGSVTVNDVETDVVRRVNLYNGLNFEYCTVIQSTFGYFPEIGSILTSVLSAANKNIRIEVPADTKGVQFVFGVCSAPLEMFLKKQPK